MLNVSESVSVIISAYNRPDFLQTAIQSVLKQKYPIQEIIVVDDYSPVNLESVVLLFGEKKLRYIRSESNLGANHSRNIGLQLASSTWVAFLDDDDIWLENKLIEQFTALQKHQVLVSLCSYEFLETGDRYSALESGFVSIDKLKIHRIPC